MADRVADCPRCGVWWPLAGTLDSDFHPCRTVTVLLGNEFKCKERCERFDYIRTKNGTLGHLGTVNATRCSYICYITPRCHGYTSYTNQEGVNMCELFDYYASPSDSLLVEDYYLLHCV